jgi:virginiamycin B lyase
MLSRAMINLNLTWIISASLVLFSSLLQAAGGDYAATLTEWQLPIPVGSKPNANRKLVFDENRSCVYYSAPERNRIGRLNTKTNMITEWKLPDNWSGPFFLFPDRSGNVFYTTRGEIIGKLNPETGIFTQWQIPREDNDPEEIALYEIDQDADGNLWVMGNTNHKIYRLNPLTNVITTYFFPHREPYSTNLRVDPNGQVFWLGSRDSNSVSVLDPSTNLYREWPIPTWRPDSVEPSKTSFPKGLSANRPGLVFFLEKDGNKFGRINTENNRITEWTIPTVATPPPNVFGNPGAGMQELVADDQRGEFYFVEAYADKVGRLNLQKDQLIEWSLPPSDIADGFGGFRKFPMGIDLSGQGDVYYVTNFDAKVGRLTFSAQEN